MSELKETCEICANKDGEIVLITDNSKLRFAYVGEDQIEKHLLDSFMQYINEHESFNGYGYDDCRVKFEIIIKDIQ